MRRLTLLFLSFMLLLSGCMPYVRQPPEAETTRITVGFSQVGAESDWRVANTESMRESLSEENGFELLFDNARQEQENQFKAIRTFIQQDVDYIVLAPVTETGWESVLEEARTAGIPVFADSAADLLDELGRFRLQKDRRRGRFMAGGDAGGPRKRRRGGTDPAFAGHARLHGAAPALCRSGGRCGQSRGLDDHRAAERRFHAGKGI